MFTMISAIGEDELWFHFYTIWIENKIKMIKNMNLYYVHHFIDF